MRVLFIGGEADGEWHDYDKHGLTPFRRVAVRQLYPATAFFKGKIPKKFELPESQLYTLTYIRQRIVYVYQPLNSDDVLHLLVDNYRPNKTKWAT